MSVTEISLLDQWRGKSTEKFIPMQASLELTYRCNERCTHCYIEKFHDNPNKILNLEQWFTVLEKLRSAGTLYLILMGGEAMLNPLFWDISKKAADLGFHTSLITNGLKINSLEIAQKLKDNGLQIITFSLYSLNAEIHERMTQVKGSLQKTINAIEFCKTVGLEVSVNSLLTKENVQTLFELYDWCVERKIDMKVDPTITPKLNGDLSPTHYRANNEQIRWFYTERTKRWQNARPTPSLDKDDDYVCNAAKGKCAVNPYGELLPCIEVREPLGNLVTDDFEHIWQSPTALKWRQFQIKDLKNMESLETYNFCDNCPGMSKNETGDPLSITCFSKNLAQIKMEVSREFKK